MTKFGVKKAIIMVQVGSELGIVLMVKVCFYPHVDEASHLLRIRPNSTEFKSNEWVGGLRN